MSTIRACGREVLVGVGERSGAGLEFRVQGFAQARKLLLYFLVRNMSNAQTTDRSKNQCHHRKKTEDARNAGMQERWKKKRKGTEKRKEKETKMKRKEKEETTNEKHFKGKNGQTLCLILESLMLWKFDFWSPQRRYLDRSPKKKKEKRTTKK